jgi:hypothetical protein
MTLREKLNVINHEDAGHTSMFNIWNNTISTNTLVSEVPDINFYCAILHIQNMENSVPKLHEVIGGDHDKHFLSSNCMSEVHHCTATDHQSGVTLRLETKKNHFVPI